MKRLTLTILALAIWAGSAGAQEAQPADSTLAPAPSVTTAPPPAPPPLTEPAGQSRQSKIFYGGSVTFAFGGATHIGIFPMIGYKMSPKASVGAKVGYEYVNYDDFDESSHNYGAGVFGRYRAIPQLYGQAEFQAVNYEIFTTASSSHREWVPFLLLGGGYIKALSPRTSVYAEVLFDVIQDNDSPYDDWEPRVSLGIGVGF